MRLGLLAGTLAVVMLAAHPAVAQDDRKPSPVKSSEAKRSGMSEDMRQAIEWERAKDRAAARQAAIEAGKSGRERTADRVSEGATKPKDTKATVKKNQ